MKKSQLIKGILYIGKGTTKNSYFFKKFNGKLNDEIKREMFFSTVKTVTGLSINEVERIFSINNEDIERAVTIAFESMDTITIEKRGDFYCLEGLILHKDELRIIE